MSEMPVTKLLIRSGQLAHNKYKRRVEDEAAEEQIIKKARMLRETEKKELSETAQKSEVEKKSFHDKEKSLTEEDKRLRKMISKLRKSCLKKQIPD